MVMGISFWNSDMIGDQGAGAKTCILLAFAWAGYAAPVWGQVIVPKAALTVEVVDEAEILIANANGCILALESSDNARHIAETDQKGRIAAVLPSFGYLFYSVGKDGYYSAWGKYQFDSGAMTGESATWGKKKWLPWNPVVRVALKKKGQPVAMFANGVYLAPPVSDGMPIGFDLEAGDWLAPHGRGKRADIFFSAKGSIESSDLALTWSFPNKGDGIVVYPYEGGARSELRSPTFAPESGYLPHITVDAEARPIGQAGDARPLSFVFRVRTVLDAAGNVVSANYDKIYPEAYKAVFYLNPTPNSRVLEYDPRNNLQTELKNYEKINDP